jgi:hypothetical protein
MIYEARTESLFQENAVPRLMRDPDGQFTAVWDFFSVFMLVYVTITVPLRVCFGVEIELWSFSFFVEATVDLFFIIDVVLNFRTPFFDRHGFREDRPKEIAKQYIRGWFTIDIVSCVPFGYVQYLHNSDEVSTSQGASNELKGIKAIRLMKITKMMRLARIKRIIMRHSEDGAGLGTYSDETPAIIFLCVPYKMPRLPSQAWPSSQLIRQINDWG